MVAPFHTALNMLKLSIGLRVPVLEHNEMSLLLKYRDRRESIVAKRIKSKRQNKTPALGIDHERLGAFVGKWHAEGHSYAAGQSKKNPRGAVEKWVSDETFEWLAGQFFIMQKWDAMTGLDKFKGVAIIHYDPEIREYKTRSYENHGFISDYVTRVDGDTWTFIGDTERARVEFMDGGDTQKISWEWRKNGKAWLPLCDRVAKRVG